MWSTSSCGKRGSKHVSGEAIFVNFDSRNVTKKDEWIRYPND
jgi:hypothetical protein